MNEASDTLASVASLVAAVKTAVCPTPLTCYSRPPAGAPHEPAAVASHANAAAGVPTAQYGSHSADVTARVAKQQQEQQQQHSLHSSPHPHQHQHLRINTTRCSPQPYHQHPHAHPQRASTPRSGSAGRSSLHLHRSLHRPHQQQHLQLRGSYSGRFRVGFGCPSPSPPAGRIFRAANGAAGSPVAPLAGGSHAIPEDAAACMGAVVEVSAACSAGAAAAGGAAGVSTGGGLGSRRRSRLSLSPFGIELAEEEESRREQQLYAVCSAFATLAAAAAVDEPEDVMPASASVLRGFSSAATASGASDRFSPAGAGMGPRCASVADVAPIIAAYSCATPVRLRAAAGIFTPVGGRGTYSGADERGVALCGSDDGQEAEEEQYGWLYSSDDEEDVDRAARASVAEAVAPLPAAGGGAGGGGTSQQPSRFSWVKLFTAPLRAFPGVSGLDEDAEHASFGAGAHAGKAAGAVEDGAGGRPACDTPPPSQPPPARTASVNADDAAGVSGRGVVGGSSASATGSGAQSEASSSWASPQPTRSNSRGCVPSNGSGCLGQRQAGAGEAAAAASGGSSAATGRREASAHGGASGPAGNDTCALTSCGSDASGRPAPRLSLLLDGGSRAASRRKLQVGVAGGDVPAGGGVPAAPAVPNRYSWRRLTSR